MTHAHWALMSNLQPQRVCSLTADLRATQGRIQTQKWWGGALIWHPLISAFNLGRNLLQVPENRWINPGSLPSPSPAVPASWARFLTNVGIRALLAEEIGPSSSSPYTH